MALSFISRGFKSFFRSGVEFSEKIIPAFLEKCGVPKRAAAVIGKAVGGAAGLASAVTGAYFFVAIPVSLPMFLVASGVLPVKGAAAAAIAASILAGVGTVVTTTGLGMCRAFTKGCRNIIRTTRTHLSHKPASAPEKSMFKATSSTKCDFEKAVSPPTPARAFKAAIPSPRMNTNKHE